MTLENLLLEKLAEWRPDNNGRQTLTVADPDSGWRVAVAAEQCDSVGCRIWELSLTRTRDRAADHLGELRAWADRLGARATGLMEPLRLLELDPAQEVALLRSQAPAKRGEALFYYEVTLTVRSKGEANVRRYQATRDGNSRREQVPFALTHEALAKLAQDIAADI
jgi:hypothetical protein